MRDCWRQCVAKVIGVDPAFVPDFVNMDGPDWLESTHDWLLMMRWDMVASIPLGQQVDMRLFVRPELVPVILVGTSTTSDCHAVVMGRGGHVWDPEPGGQGLTTVLAMYWLFEPIEVPGG